MIWVKRDTAVRRSAACGLKAASAFALCFAWLGCAAAAQQPAENTQAAQKQAAQSAGPRQTGQPPAPAPGQQTFDHAQQAVDALVAAVKNQDSQALVKILGPDANAILSSGDEVQDRQDRQQFLEKYAQMHRLLTEGDGLTTLYVGAENWPSPIPLAQQGHRWFFDTPAAEQVILYRRIGENEISVIEICGELVNAEKEYYAEPHGGGHQYAQKIMSDSGTHDGLFWPSPAGQAQSPLGPLLAKAEAEGYAQPEPFHGYYFRILKQQVTGAGHVNLVAGGKMTQGFAFVAYPAAYRSSGVMTFLVNQSGVVYQKDLGPKTAEIAHSMKEYRIDASWHKAD